MEQSAFGHLASQEKVDYVTLLEIQARKKTLLSVRSPIVVELGLLLLRIAAAAVVVTSFTYLIHL